MTTFFITTLGCKVNQCDSQEIRERFLTWGWREAPASGEADVGVINSCCVTHQADAKSRHAIRRHLRQRAHPRALTLVTGCYAAYDRAAIQALPGVDAVFDAGQKSELFAWLSRRLGTPDFPVEATVCFGGRCRAFLKVQEGCDHFCSYCVVPFVRGRSRSVPPKEAVAQALRFADAGHREIVVSGTNLAAYGNDVNPAVGLVDLLKALEKIERIRRIRLSSMEATDIDERLLELMASSDKLCPHLHIPFQSGDDTVLAHMNKKITTGHYRRLVQRARAMIKDLSVTCDMIIGYPAESDRTHRHTMDFLKEIRPLRAHLFRFSPRRGVLLSRTAVTAPAPALVSDRFDQIKELADHLSCDVQRSYLGRTFPVLFEERKGALWLGHTPNYLQVSLANATGLRNEILWVKLAGFARGTLVGVKGKEK